MNSGALKGSGLDIVFNPRHTRATLEQFDKILDHLYAQGNNEFKIIGTHKYNSLEELEKTWK